MGVSSFMNVMPLESLGVLFVYPTKMQSLMDQLIPPQSLMAQLIPPQ